MSQGDLLDDVVRALNERQGDLPTVARETGIAYDTILRIRRRENDPGYSKVATLHRYFFGERNAAEPAHPAAQD
ncbi:MAG TPA: hypothetical protein VFM98_08815 [Ramlibacter sp.]|uniref:hypothetical protein n=1 Tax=Ramlibacter sp. TaxID=1917967 RepID=UPI002D7EB53B|nr:hypothetical protein [Ramlibacter sp.]HET8745694.1 hypothetical protein [Ramlibacter sp.]